MIFIHQWWTMMMLHLILYTGDNDDILKRSRLKCRVTDYVSLIWSHDTVTVWGSLTSTRYSLWRLNPLCVLYFRNREFKLSIFLYRGTERQRTDSRSTLSPELTVTPSSAVAVCVLLCVGDGGVGGVEIYYRYLLSAPALLLTLGGQIYTCTCCFSFCSVAATRDERNGFGGNGIHISISYKGYYTLYVVYMNWRTLKDVLKHPGVSESLHHASLNTTLRLMQLTCKWKAAAERYSRDSASVVPLASLCSCL